MLSHGQAGVECGFSINKELMEYNFKERSVISQRVIYDHIQAVGGTVSLSKKQKKITP